MATESVAVSTASEVESSSPTVWKVDPAHSSAEFAVRHMMVSTVKGSFKTLSGSIRYDESDPEKSRIEAEIDAASIDTGVADRDTHLRSADFFDVARFPRLAFRSTGVEANGDTGKLHGDLTIHGVTRPVSLDVAFLGEVKDPWGSRRRGYSAETTLNRKDFGMTWNMVLDAGGVLVGDRVKVTLNIEAVEQANA